MRINKISSIANDLLDLISWRNPLERFLLNKRYHINLLNGIVNWEKDDSVGKLLKTKREWFLDRIRKMNGNLKDFSKAEIIVHLKKEEVRLIYKGREFFNERTWN